MSRAYDHPTSLIDQLPIGTCIVDPDWVTHAWNSRLEAWTGLPRERVLGQKLTSFYPALMAQRTRRRMTSVFETGAPMVFSAAIHKHLIPIGPEDQPDHWMIQDAQIQRISSDPPRALITIVDKTAECRQLGELRTERRRLRQANEKAQIATRAKTAFLANMSHEIRTPMTAILGYTELLQIAQLSEDERHGHINTIRRSGEHLLAIINDILDLSKIEAEALEPERIAFDPSAVLDEVICSMQGKAADRGIELMTESQSPIPERIHSDPTRLRQILVNLVGNAIKFTSVGHVRVVSFLDANASPPMLCFEVHDTGTGIARDEIPSLFENFTQGNSATARKYGGTGLGLAISKKLTHILGGQITAQSKLGQGSCFAFQIAIEPNDLKDCEASSASGTDKRNELPADAQPLGGHRILIVEDAPDNQRLISYHLQEAGAEWALANNGQEAIDLVFDAARQGRSHDAILMDMQMPVMDGYQTTQMLRDHGYTAPIIAITAHAMSHDRNLCEQAGCNGYLTKPFNPKELIGTLARLIRANEAPRAARAA